MQGRESGIWFSVHRVQVVESGLKPTAPLVLRIEQKDSNCHRWFVRGRR